MLTPRGLGKLGNSLLPREPILAAKLIIISDIQPLWNSKKSSFNVSGWLLFDEDEEGGLLSI